MPMQNLGIKEMESLIYTLELSQKSDFQLLTTKPDNEVHPTIETGQSSGL